MARSQPCFNQRLLEHIALGVRAAQRDQQLAHFGEAVRRRLVVSVSECRQCLHDRRDDRRGGRVSSLGRLLKPVEQFAQTDFVAERCQSHRPMYVDPGSARARERGLGQIRDGAPVGMLSAVAADRVVQPAAPEQRGGVGDSAQRIALHIRSGANRFVVQRQRIGSFAIGQQEERLMPGQMTIETQPARESRSAIAEEIRAAS